MVVDLVAKRRRTSCANPDCRRPCVPRDRGLCDPCLAAYRAQHDRNRIGKRERSHYDNAWRKRSKQEIRTHVATFGYICPTCDTADPETNPLTLDHVVPRDATVTAVRCRRCNAQKSNKRTDPT